MQSYLNCNWFCLSMTSFNHTFLYFSYFYLLPTVYIESSTHTSLFKVVFYLVNWSATIYDFWQGGRGVSQFWIFYDKGGGGLGQFLIFGWPGGSGGLDPSTFGWHHMWTAPSQEWHFYGFIKLSSLQNNFFSPASPASMYGHVGM